MCNRKCKRLTVSTSVAVVGTDLVISIPQKTYNNFDKLCLLINQTIPDAATINMPVSIAIGTDTAVLYPLTSFNGVQITARNLSIDTLYPLIVVTNSTSATFNILCKTCQPYRNSLQSIPVTTTNGE